MNFYRGHIPISEPLGGVLERQRMLPGSSDHAVEELDLLGVGSQGHDRLFALGGVTGMHALAAITAAHRNGVDLGDLDAEQFLDRLGDVDLGGVSAATGFPVYPISRPVIPPPLPQFLPPLHQQPLRGLL